MQKEFSYFDKLAIRPPLISKPLANNTIGIITIPVHAEKELIQTLESLASCNAPKGSFEVIILFNHSILATQFVKDQNYQMESSTLSWIVDHPSEHLDFHVLKEFSLQDKKAGVGTARKILMDEAARRLSASGMLQSPIVGLDADCLVQKNYLVEIEKYFKTHLDVNACSIHFEHQLEGLSSVQELAITRYEQHLRYYISAQRKAGFPFAYQTIGSAMAVRCKDYMKQGGMNRRKAGEDFYFLHKFIELGNYGEMNGTTVYPSGRVSDRVPFGTGKAVKDAMEKEGILLTYHIQSFKDVKVFFEGIETLWDLPPEHISHFLEDMPPSIREYSHTIDFELKMSTIKSNTSSKNAYKKRFFRWFNAFQLMKYLHFARDNFYPNQPVESMAAELKKWEMTD